MLETFVQRVTPPHNRAAPAWRNPLARGLVFLTCGADIQGPAGSSAAAGIGAVTDSVAKRVATAGFLTHKKALGQSGYGRNSTNISGNGIEFDVGPAQGHPYNTSNLTQSPASWVFRIRCRDATLCELACQSQNGGTVQGWNIGSGGTGGAPDGNWGLYLIRSTSRAQMRIATSAIPTTRDCTIVVTSPGTNDLSSGRVYLDGARLGVNYVSGVGTTVVSTDKLQLQASAITSGRRNLDGHMYMSGIYNRQLQDYEARQLSLNPWQIFEQRRTLRAGRMTLDNYALYFGSGSTQ